MRRVLFFSLLGSPSANKDTCLAGEACNDATVNIRQPLISRSLFSVRNISSQVTIRRGQRTDELVAGMCQRAVSFGQVCTDEDTNKLRSAVAPYVQSQDIGFGEEVLRQLKMGWKLVAELSEVSEGILQFMHARSAYPASKFIMREFTAAMIHSSLAETVAPVKGAGETWFYAKKQNGPLQIMESWEACSVMRYALLEKPISDEEKDFLASGISAASIVPGSAPCGGLEDTHDGILEHRILHDLELVNLLDRRGLVSKSHVVSAGAIYEDILKRAERYNVSKPGRSNRTALRVAEYQWRLLYPYFNRRLYIHAAPRVPNAVAYSSWERSYLRSASPRNSEAGGALSDGSVIVIDNFLSQRALSIIRDFLQLSTIWYSPHGSYLGAVGLSNPLLIQIVEEIQSAFPAILCDLHITNVWAFKFDEGEESGVGVHADDSAINVNLWITDDEANMNKGSGGLVIYDAIAESSSSFQEYNGESHSTMSALEKTGHSSVTVPYKENRAVIFPSARFHRTQEFNFGKGSILKRRINLTFLYGPRQSYCSLKTDARR